MPLGWLKKLLKNSLYIALIVPPKNSLKIYTKKSLEEALKFL